MTTNKDLIEHLRVNSLEFLNELKVCFNTASIKDVIKRMDNDDFVVQFGDMVNNNIRTFEDIVKDFDSLNRYTLMANIKTLNDNVIRTNLSILDLLNDNIRSQVYLFPDIDVNLLMLLNQQESQIFDLYKKLVLYNKYFLITKKLMISKQTTNTFNTSNIDKEQIFSDVREHVSGLQNNGLNTAVNEVISELGTNGGFEGLMAQGMNNITGGKVINMAKRVAGNLSQKVESGEVDLKELVDGSKGFINNIMDSPMFNSHPDSSNIKNMFSELLHTVEELGDAHKENTESKDIDKLLGIEDSRE